MRRLIAMLLLAVFVLPLVSSSMALGQDTDAGLPACCRRTGAHHCAMSMGERADLARVAPRDTRLQAPAASCPYSRAHCVTLHPDPFVGSGTGVVSLATYGQAAPTPQAECSRRIARERARQKRGPPSFLIA